MGPMQLIAKSEFGEKYYEFLEFTKKTP